MMKKKRQSLVEEERRMEELLQKVGYTGKYKGSTPYERPNYNVRSGLPQLSNKVGNGPKRKVNTYTGDEFIGYATMHKSNSIPITNKQQAIEVAQMRRS